MAGFQYTTRMAIIRLSDGGLFIWSPVAADDGLMEAVAQLGPVRHIVAPNHLHHLNLGSWKNYFPSALLYAPPGLRQKRKDLSFDLDLVGDSSAHSIPAWAQDIAFVLVEGNLITQEVVFFHHKSQTVLFCDLLQQFPRDWHKGWRGVVARLDLMSEPLPTVPRKFRFAFFRRKLARTAIRTILKWPIEKVVMAHGTLVEKDSHTFLKRAFAWLEINTD